MNSSHEYEREITKEDLEYIITHSDKKRHEIVKDKIRALYGHSTPIKIEKTKATPPDVLYHGTAKRFLSSILKDGLLPMKRQYVHLSVDTDMATLVGKRKDNNPVILQIDAKTAYEDGLPFYIGNEKVWLCDQVPPQYIKILEHKEKWKKVILRSYICTSLNNLLFSYQLSDLEYPFFMWQLAS